MFVVNQDVVTTTAQKATGTLNHHSYGHIPILTMMTWFGGLLRNDSFLVRLAITFSQGAEGPKSL